MMLILCKFEKVHDGWKVKLNKDDFYKAEIVLHVNLTKFYEKYNLPRSEIIPLIQDIAKYLKKNGVWVG